MTPKLFISLIISILTLQCAVYAENAIIHEHGYWIGEVDHAYDPDLSAALAVFFKNENAQSVVDFGCGKADYIKYLIMNQIYCEGYDGNPDTYRVSEGFANMLDLSYPFDLGKRFDWVLSIEVGEHLPQQYEQTFIENIDRHNTKGVVISWAVKGQGGYGHFNEQNNDYIKSVMARYGYLNDVNAENELRRAASLGWLTRTVMVFRRPG